MIDISWSSNLAYAVGLVTSDGCLSKDGRHIDFTSKDLEQIQNFKSILKIDNKIGLKYRGPDRNRYYPRIQFGDVRFYKFLLSIGLSPRKSKTIEKVRIPRKLPWKPRYYDRRACLGNTRDRGRPQVHRFDEIQGNLLAGCNSFSRSGNRTSRFHF